jgi:hypothetical protein
MGGRRGPPRGARTERSEKDSNDKKQEGKSDRKVGANNSSKTSGSDKSNLTDKGQSVTDSNDLVDKSEAKVTFSGIPDNESLDSIDKAKTSLKEQEASLRENVAITAS